MIAAIRVSRSSRFTRPWPYRRRALSRAVSSLLALEMGIAGQEGIAATLRDLYARARASVLASVLEWDEPTLMRIREDFIEIGAALRSGS